MIALLHAGYWLLYLLLISTFIRAIPGAYKDTSMASLGRILFFSSITLLIILPGVAGFYCFYSFLFVRYLHRKKLAALAVSGLLTALLLAIVFLMVTTASGLIKTPDTPGFTERITEVLFLTMLILIHGIIALVMRGFITWYREIKLKEDLSRKNFETELALVKSQVNPHFLFNTISNIDVLIQQDPGKASACLNMLSDIMRFMLYETKTELIPLSKELAYIEKYIHLQKIRTSNPGYVHYCRQGDAEGLLLEPMLMIPFIENAFKYSGNRQLENAIRINIIITKQQLNFTCENNYNQMLQQAGEGGLGNELILKRLMLLYPGKHQLEITDADNHYKVNLLLTLHED